MYLNDEYPPNVYSVGFRLISKYCDIQSKLTIWDWLRIGYIRIYLVHASIQNMCGSPSDHGKSVLKSQNYL